MLGYYALMLRPGQTLRLPARSPASVFHLIEGSVDVAIEAMAPQAFRLAEADTCCAPGYAAVHARQRGRRPPGLPVHRRRGAAAPQARHPRKHAPDSTWSQAPRCVSAQTQRNYRRPPR